MQTSNDFDAQLFKPFLLRFGDKVRELRVKLNWTQPDLAERVGCSVQHISNIERGQSCNFMFVIALANVFDCSIDYLTGQELYRTHELKGVCEFTGLSAPAAQKLHDKKSDNTNLLELQVLSSAIEKTNLSEHIADYWSLQPLRKPEDEKLMGNVTLDVMEKLDKNSEIVASIPKTIHVKPDMKINGMDIGRQTFKEVVLKEIQKDLEVLIEKEQKERGEKK